MKTYRNTDCRRRGSSLVTVMILIFTMAAFVGIIAHTSMQSKHMAVKLGDRIRAQSIAEAGMSHAYSILSTNWAASTNGTFPLGVNYADGVYTASISMAASTSAIAEITSRGAYGIADATVAMNILYDGGGNFAWPSNIANYAVLCGGTFDFGGCGTMASTNETALLHANGAVTISGSANVGGDIGRLDIESSVSILVKNNNTVNGDAKAPSMDIKGTVTGAQAPGAVPAIEIPQLALDPFYQWALAHGDVRPAGWAPSGECTPNGGFYYITGSSGTINQGPIHGGIIAEGAVKLSGQVSIEAAAGSGGFAVIAGTGDIDNQSTGTIEGIVYAKTGNFKQTANGVLIGQLVVKGSISKGGVSDVIVQEEITATLPDGSTGTASDLDVSAWTK